MTARLAAEMGPSTVPAAPPTADLLANWEDENYVLTVDAAADLGFAVGSISGSYQQEVLIHGSARWGDVHDGAGNTYRFGVALRALVIVSAANIDGALTLPVIAAKAQLGLVTATGELLVRGYKGDPGSLPDLSTFDVDGFNKYRVAVDSLRDKILNDAANIQPVLLATDAVDSQSSSPEEAVGVTYALTAVANGMSLDRALGRLAVHSQVMRAAIRQVYAARIGGDDATAPDSAESKAARHDLAGFELTHPTFGFLRH